MEPLGTHVEVHLKRDNLGVIILHVHHISCENIKTPVSFVVYMYEEYNVVHVCVYQNQ